MHCYEHTGAMTILVTASERVALMTCIYHHLHGLGEMTGNKSKKVQKLMKSTVLDVLNGVSFVFFVFFSCLYNQFHIRFMY